MNKYTRLLGAKLHNHGLVQVNWVRRSHDSILAASFTRSTVWSRPTAVDRAVEARAALTNAIGAKPLWSGYEQVDSATRTSDQVRTSAATGRLYRRLVLHLRPEVIVEVGTAFGISGMYWLAGLEANDLGHLYTFDPNSAWMDAARANLETIGQRFTATNDTVESGLSRVLNVGAVIDLAFIDGIHTSSFVNQQFDLIAARSRSGSILVLDDVNFSADMRECWRRLANDPRVRAALTLGRRVGLVELL